MTWPLVLLDSVAERGSGHTPSQKHPEYWNGGIKWVSLADSHALDQGYIHETAKNISMLGIRHSSAVLHPPETVIISRDAGVGKSAILGDQMAVSQHFIAWRCDESKISAQYLYHWLQFEKPEFERMATGSTVKTIGLGYFQKLRIPLPPIGEQRAISKALNDWDFAIQKTEQLITAKQRHYTHELSRLISRGQKPQSHAGAVAGEVSARNRSSTWRTLLLSDIATVWKGQQLNKDVMVEDGTYYALNGGVKPSGRTTEWNCEAGTITVSEGGNSCGFVSYNRERFWCGGHCYALKNLDSEVDAHYLFHYLKGRQARVMALRVGSGLPNIQKSDIEAFPIVIPELATQTVIARYLEAIREEIDLLGESVAALKAQKRGLMQKLLIGQWRLPVGKEVMT